MMTKAEKLLVVLEDSDEDFDTILDALKKAGRKYEVRRATTGEGCLKLLQKHEGEMLSAALVLLDLNTPGTDGREVLAQIKRDDHLQPLPVVVFTTSANPRDVEQCYARGANAYHVKPVLYPNCLGILQQIFAYWMDSVLQPTRMG